MGSLRDWDFERTFVALVYGAGKGVGLRGFVLGRLTVRLVILFQCDDIDEESGNPFIHRN